jgi:hypothetical protein
MTRKRLVNADRFVAALDANAVELAPGESTRRALERAFGGHDRGAEIFVGTFEPRRHVHRVAHHRVVEALARPEIRPEITGRKRPRRYIRRSIGNFGSGPKYALEIRERGPHPANPSSRHTKDIGRLFLSKRIALSRTN